MTLKELIQRAIDIANAGLTEASASESTAEALLPTVFREVGVRMAGNERLRTTLRRTKQLAVVNGAVALTSDVLTTYLYESNIIDPADPTKLYSLTPWDQLLTGQLDQRLGHFALEGEAQLHVVEPNETYDPVAGPTVALLLTVPCIPAIPALVTDAVVANTEVTAELLNALAGALKIAAAK